MMRELIMKKERIEAIDGVDARKMHHLLGAHIEECRIRWQVSSVSKCDYVTSSVCELRTSKFARMAPVQATKDEEGWRVM